MSASTLKKPAGSKVTIGPAQKEILRAYVKARRQAAAANKIVESKKEEVLAIVRLLGGRAVYLNGLMYAGDSVSYEYPASIKNRREKLGQDMKLMQLNGRARKQIKQVLMFEDLKAKASAAAAQTS